MFRTFKGILSVLIQVARMAIVLLFVVLFFIPNTNKVVVPMMSTLSQLILPVLQVAEFFSKSPAPAGDNNEARPDSRLPWVL